MKNQKLKGNSMLLLAAIVWGASFIAQSKGVELISATSFNGIRCLLGAVVLLPVIFILDMGKKKRGAAVAKIDKNLIVAGVVCGIFLCIASTLQTYGMVFTSPGKAGFITALYMVIIPIIGVFTGKKPRAAIWVAVVTAVIGMYLMCIDSKLTINKGDVIVLISAFAFVGHILTIDYFSPKVDGVKLSCLQFFVCGAIDMIYVFIFEDLQLAPVLNCWASIGYAGIMSCGVAYTLQIVGQKYTDPTSASILMSLESVFSTLTTVILVACGWQLTGGALNLRELSGCVLMFVAIIFVQLPEKKRS
ncbi:MAG: DMT family transporter [Clostridia bacterium]|nr:DMT family transporter [Clostridia bacterium]